MRTIEQYRSLILNLLPRGLAWARERGFNMRDMIDAIAEEFYRIDLRADQALLEGDPRTTTEMLEEWEAMVGIPDECAPPALTLERRRADVIARLTMRGSLNKQFYIDFAAYLGYTITIDEYRQFQVGFSSAGDPLTNGDWVYAFLVHAPVETIKYFSTGISQVGDPLANWGNAFLECSIHKRKPAHTLDLYTYGG